MTPKLPPDNARGPVPLGRRDLAALRAFSTPAICDAIAELAPERRGYGFTTERLIAIRPELAPTIGYACTATVRTSGQAASSLLDDEGFLAWLDHVSRSRKPAVAVIQDADAARPGRAACWGASLAALHAALGCEGLVTDGAIRQAALLPADFQVLAGGVRPSGGGLRFMSAGGTVNVAGLAVTDGDLLHADRHGVVVIPEDLVREIPRVIEHSRAHDREILAACRSPGIDFAMLRSLLIGQRQTRWCS